MPLSPAASSRGMPLGLQGATASTRFVGGTTSGAPVSGTFAVGDFVVDESGAVWVCTVAGSPGTWVNAGGGGGAVTSVFTRVGAVVAVNGDYNGVVASALAGATAATRYVGGTVSGAPASGTFAAGDFVVAQNGHVWVCSVGGSPGTWVDVGVATAPVQSVFSRVGAVVAVNGDYNGVVASALTGATAATRYVGGTTSGAPTSGTFAVGDFVVAQDGAVWICTGAGTPGTWVRSDATRSNGTSALGADVTLTAANTFFDGPNTGAIGAAGQVLLLMGYCSVIGSAAGHAISVRLTDGTTNFCEGGSATNATQPVTTPLGPIVIAPAGSATYKLQAASNTGTTDVMKADLSVNGSGNIATRITWVRLV